MQRTLSPVSPVQVWILAQWAALRASWFWSAVLVPFGITRLAWVLAAAFARGYLQPNPTYLKYVQQGGIHTRVFLLDIFAHWDAGFYLTIVKEGYWLRTNLTEQYSNVAFFPLYPYLVKSVGWLGVRLPTAGYIAIGLLLSNACFLAAMVLLYRLAVQHVSLRDSAARRAILLIMVFPTSFFFSSFYTESLFLFLTLLGFVAALDRRWWLAGLASGLLVLTRTQGVIVVAVLAFLYMDARGWRWRAIRPDVLWFGLAPLALGAHLFSLYQITGTFFAPFVAMQAWQRNAYSFLDGLRMQLSGPQLDVFKIEAVLLLIFLGCGIAMLWKFPKAFGLFAILMCLAPISSGLVTGAARYIVVIFPVFLLLGQWFERRDPWFDLARGLLFTLQVLYFAAWANYYWIA